MKMALLPSGDIEGVGAADVPVTLGPHVLFNATPPRPPRAPPPPPPPRAPRPPLPPAASGAPAGGVATTSVVFLTGSTTPFLVPVNVGRTYQKRRSGSQFACASPPTTRPVRLGASILVARS